MRKNEPQGELIGKIILAEFLEYPMEEFMNFIRELEELPLYQKLSYEGIITRRYLPDAKAVREESLPSGVIAEVKNDGSFSIHYSNAGFSIEYMVDNLRRAELVKVISKKNNGGIIIDTSRICRLIRGISVITPQGKEVELRCLFASKRNIMKRHIRVLLSSEREDMCGGRLKVPYTDEQLGRKLSNEHNLSITRRGVAYFRKGLGILSYSKRVDSQGYPPLSANLSTIYPFTIPSVKNNAPVSAGIYELCLDGDMAEYPAGCCQTFSIVQSYESEDK